MNRMNINEEYNINIIIVVSHNVSHRITSSSVNIITIPVIENINDWPSTTVTRNTYQLLHRSVRANRIQPSVTAVNPGTMVNVSESEFQATASFSTMNVENNK